MRDEHDSFVHMVVHSRSLLSLQYCCGVSLVEYFCLPFLLKVSNKQLPGFTVFLGDLWIELDLNIAQVLPCTSDEQSEVVASNNNHLLVRINLLCRDDCIGVVRK